MADANTQIRTARLSDAEAIAAVHVASWREAYTGLLPELNVDERTKRWRKILEAKSNKADDMTAVAMVGTRLLGFVSVGPQRDEKLHSQGFTAEFQALYVLKSAQRSGVGGKLLQQGAEHMLETGHRNAALWVLEDNGPARAFYEAMGARPIGLGARPIRLREDVRGEVSLIELAYGWRDLRELVTGHTEPVSS